MLAIIGGTGLNEFSQGEEVGERHNHYGYTSAAIIQSEIEGHQVCFLARHGNPHSIAPHQINYRANLWALKQLGVSQILAVNAVGGITPSMAAGALVCPDQLIDYTYDRQHTLYDGADDKLEHIDFSYPFSQRLRTALSNAAAHCSLPLLDKAVYGVTQGPRLETAAEINRMDRDGCDIVGMTAMPEAALARELELDYASLCLVVNPAAGRSDTLITMDDIHRVVDTGMVKVRALLTAAPAELH
ncbi:MAG: S-methyl-5'-thioinosine phosphorylase [Oceanicoccus sp.]|uniref:S-methyl-5'-thioinosine phosphorylase n=1 Tax=Oceanicoccus sp. TaxID=2691044 RepID=UPI002611AC07|nr:S-methyl-5'-thioinosine phosphorylase [Oceanicoccus sp.]MCP3907906.1 S-methyl-5'-thioinosine phosphorylase [Oceanicoccus sp.]MDG1773279.1 S-methyl-5'-thioinosine phosphorylase [Oceanicoccus sp.]